jgi:hypothetical protein
MSDWKKKVYSLMNGVPFFDSWEYDDRAQDEHEELLKKEFPEKKFSYTSNGSYESPWPYHQDLPWMIFNDDLNKFFLKRTQKMKTLVPDKHHLLFEKILKCACFLDIDKKPKESYVPWPYGWSISY